VQLLIDEDVLCDEYIGCHPCINTASLKIKTSDLLEKIIPETAHTPIIVKL
jgi:Ala-tRNA(Pro) deacylase